MNEHDFAVAVGCLPSVNIARRAKLREFFGCFEKIWGGSEKEFREAGLTEGAAEEVWNEIQISKPEKLAKSLSEKCKIVLPEDRGWPNFKNRDGNRPTAIFVTGEFPRNRAVVSIVGSRMPSVHAQIVTKKLAGDLARAGVVIASGLALGVDRLAHEAALDAGGLTVGFLACRAGEVYPAGHKNLAEKIVKLGGGIFTEYGEGQPSRERFPERNRLIAGCADAVIIVEAREKSGTLHTADHARKLHVPLFAVPADTTRENAAGSNNLLEKGVARVVCDAATILRELNIKITKNSVKNAPELFGEAKVVWEMLDGEPKTTNEICEKTGMDSASLSVVLLDLELQNLVSESFEGWVRL